jgi:RHS repeat-associated protein
LAQDATKDFETVPQPFKFAGAEYDASTGLYKMGARYYDPAVGRFTQLDALGGGYRYAANDPINLLDNTGYKPSQCKEDVQNTAKNTGAVGGGLIGLSAGTGIALVFAMLTGPAAPIAVAAVLAAAGTGAAAGAFIGANVGEMAGMDMKYDACREGNVREGDGSPEEGAMEVLSFQGTTFFENCMKAAGDGAFSAKLCGSDPGE